MIAAESKLLTYPEVGERLRSTDKNCRLVRELVQSGKLVGTNIGRNRFVSELDLLEYLKRSRTADMKEMNAAIKPRRRRRAA